MNRRDFLTRAAMVAGLLAVDPEFMLWQPTRARIVVPPLPTLLFHKDAFAFTMGDVFSVEGVFARNPITRELTPHPQLFVVTRDVQAGQPISVDLVHPRIDRTLGPRKVRPIMTGKVIAHTEILGG
jgi:hypothetical protein